VASKCPDPDEEKKRKEREEGGLLRLFLLSLPLSNPERLL